MTKREKDWIKIQSPENLHQIASPRYISKLIGLYDLEGVVSAILERVKELEKKEVIRELLKRLRKEGKPHNAIWISNRFPQINYWELLDMEEIRTTKQGHHTMFSLRDSL